MKNIQAFHVKQTIEFVDRQQSRLLSLFFCQNPMRRAILERQNSPVQYQNHIVRFLSIHRHHACTNQFRPKSEMNLGHSILNNTYAQKSRHCQHYSDITIKKCLACSILNMLCETGTQKLKRFKPYYNFYDKV